MYCYERQQGVVRRDRNSGLSSHRTRLVGSRHAANPPRLGPGTQVCMHPGTTQERCAHSFTLFSLWEWNVKYPFFFLGRGFMDAWTTLWASWVVEQALPGTTGSDRASVYFSG